MNKLKTKISLALVFLLVLIISLGIFGSNFIGQLADDSKAIIQANYNSIGYVSSMQKAAEKLYDIYIDRYYNTGNGSDIADTYRSAVVQFEENLDRETNNITESGEKELAYRLKASFNSYKKLISSVTGSRAELVNPAVLDRNKAELNDLLWKIHQLNMKAIVHKSERADKTAERVSVYMIVSGSVASLMAVLLLLYLPGYLLRPISELREKIKEISQGNYNQRVSVSSKDEIGDLAQTFNFMAARLYEYDRNNIHKLLVEKKRLESIVNGLNDAVLIIDENRNVLYANKVILELAALEHDSLAGTYAPDSAADNDVIRYLIQNLSLSGSDISPLNYGGRFYTREIIEIKLSEEDLPEQSEAGFICILKNITQYEERNSAKTKLIATVSHELKTPLSSINLSLKLLENPKLGGLNDEQRKILASLRQQTLRISKMVNELLDFSQVESGNIRLRLSSVSPNDILDYAATAMMVLLADKDIRLETSVEDNLPLVYVDLEKSVWVLTNLITNAVRYTSVSGVITIGIKRREEYVVFSVSDQGSGISDEDKGRIFERFVQADSGNSKGRGLGLAISKEFVLGQGGNIWLDSSLGMGSTFYFSLPLYDSNNRNDL